MSINIYWYVCRSAQHLGETVADDMHNEKQSVRPHHSWLKGQDKGKLESQLLRHGAIHPRCPHNIHRLKQLIHRPGHGLSARKYKRNCRPNPAVDALKDNTCALFVACLGETVASHLVVFNQVCCDLVQSMLIMNLHTSFVDGQYLIGASVCKQHQAHTFF